MFDKHPFLRGDANKYVESTVQHQWDVPDGATFVGDTDGDGMLEWVMDTDGDGLFDTVFEVVAGIAGALFGF